MLHGMLLEEYGSSCNAQQFMPTGRMIELSWTIHLTFWTLIVPYLVDTITLWNHESSQVATTMHEAVKTVDQEFSNIGLVVTSFLLSSIWDVE